MIPGRSDYETWVLTLRDWRTNPQQDLTGLPALAEEDLSPEAFSRLVDHITEAIQAVTDAWQENLSRTTQEARTDFELARALAGSRRYLRRRVELARHPGLPEALRKVLDDGCTRDVTRMQGELEQQMRDMAAQEPGQATFWGARLLVAKQNPITAVLAADPSPAAPPPAPPAHHASPANRWSHRRIL